MSPEQAAFAGYTVIQSPLIERGAIVAANKVFSVTGLDRPIVYAHPLDYIALAWPDPSEHLDRAIGWVLGEAFRRFDYVAAHLGEPA